MAGLIKTILVLAHGAAPPNLHAANVNPRIDLASLPAVLPIPGALTRLSSPCLSSPITPVESPATANGGFEERGEGEEVAGGEGGKAEERRNAEARRGIAGSEEGGGSASAAAAVMTSDAAAAAAAAGVTDDSDDCCSVGREKSSNHHQREQERCSAPGLYGGVSSFGFGGTNAHVVLEGVPGAFSGEAEVDGTPEPVPGLAFLFTGQGSQYPGMGRDLYDTCAEFREVVDACDAALADVLPQRLLTVLYGEEKEAGVFFVFVSIWLFYAKKCFFFFFCAFRWERLYIF